MFKNSQEFEEKLKQVLITIHNDSDNVESWYQGLTEIQFHDIVEYSIRANLLTGLKTKLGADESLSISVSTPRLTYEGMNFIEK